MPKNKNKNKNTSGWPQSSLQCQMIGNNEVLYIYAVGNREYSRNPIFSELSICM